MPVVKDRHTIIIEKQVKQDVQCYHCGTPCITSAIHIDEKVFCCEGCKLVYEILNNNGLCDYYKLQSHPGLTQIKPLRNDKYSYLDSAEIAQKLYKFTDGNHTIVTFYIPGVHCSSCMWLLEHLNKLNQGVTESRLNFTTKEVTIHFSQQATTLRKVVELLATIGYEPYISLDDAGSKGTKSINKKRIYKLGVAGFCFGNIMMMSFPEYLSKGTGIEHQYAQLFRLLNLLLALPVFFYSASEFFVTAWKGLKQKILNIDTPVALAIIITFTRSVYEIATGTGSGYLDSMSGIVFFMLVGRAVQERTYRSISFHRDYKSYFPIAVNVVTASGIIHKSLQDLAEKDIVQLHNEEIIPADAVVIKGNARIDYSFVTGESEPVAIEERKMVYAGGKQVGDLLTIQIIKPVAGSYLTSLWNHYAFSKDKAEENNKNTAVDILSKYFTWGLLVLALGTTIYWGVNDPSRIITSISAMLIVACPCALLLASTFTNGNLLRIFSNNGLFLRDASVIEQLKKINHIVFDKTGTLTQGSNRVQVKGHQLTDDESQWVYSVVSPSKHPYSKALATYLGARSIVTMSDWSEIPGKGITAMVNGNHIIVGSASFVGISSYERAKDNANVYVRINDNISAFHLLPNFRDSIPQLIPALANNYSLSLLSGDNTRQQPALQTLFGNNSDLLFNQKPIDKLNYIGSLQRKQERVMMIGDGLNDAGALQQSDVGVTLADDINNFTPSCDAILDAKRFAQLPQLLRLAKTAPFIIKFSFSFSVIYNIAGLYFAMRGQMTPVIAAILMPCSTLSIVLITTGISSMLAKRLHLSLRSPDQ